MRQIFQSLKTGIAKAAEVPCPSLQPGHVLIRTGRTLISAGTERALVDFGRAGWLDKARQRPDKVKAVFEKVRTDGIAPTLEAVLNKLELPLPMGYCNVGRVLEVAGGVAGLSSGDRVVSNGSHAEVVSVPANLCARVPPNVADDHAAFAVLGSVALQGIRLAQPTLGESFVVTGLGLVGLMTVQLLRAHGCRVLGMDPDRERLALARRFGAEVVDLSAGEDPVTAARTFSRGRGADGVLITASTTSNEPVHQAAQICRKRGRIVLVGVAGLELQRADFYEKELSFQVSCSYGPGRYDPSYEQSGVDYPVGFVRWTEQRNFEAVLDMLSDGRLDVEPLISHRFGVADAQKAYELVAAAGPSLGILLQFDGEDRKTDSELRRATVPLAPRAAKSDGACVAFVGSGNFASGVLMPAFRSIGVRLKTVASSGGASGAHAGRKNGFEEATTNVDAVFSDAELDAVVIATRHDSHSELVVRALAAGKNVFVEKPLALTQDGLQSVATAHAAAVAKAASCGLPAPLLMVGFNRRFAPHIVKIKQLLAGVKEPKALVLTVNAGSLPPDHWTNDPVTGGGRFLGEACHFVDLLRFLTGAAVAGVQVASIRPAPGEQAADDRSTVTLRFEDGSIGTIHYFANGHKSLAKERLEVFAGGRVLQLDNYRRLTGFGWPGFSRLGGWRQDKGHRACVGAFIGALGTGLPPISFEEIVEVSRISIEAAIALRQQ